MALAAVTQREIHLRQTQRLARLAAVAPLELAVNDRQPVLAEQPVEKVLALSLVPRAHGIETGEAETAIGQALEDQRGTRHLEAVDLELASQQRPPGQADAQLFQAQRRRFAVGGEHLQPLHL